MLASPADFASLFLYEGNAEEPYWMPGWPPGEQTVAEVSRILHDELGFASHQVHFRRLAEVMGTCISEALASRGGSIAATKTIAHPSVLALAHLGPNEQAGLSAAAVQGLVWFNQTKYLGRDAFLRNQVAMRVMVAVLMVIGVKARGFSPAQLAGIASIAAPFRDTGHFELRAHDAIVKLLAANVKNIPKNSKTSADVHQLLDRPQYGSTPQWLVSAEKKLRAHLGL
jgi:hypothetical protein